jgi:predicted metal-dependent phosphoesterase TrpH
LKEKFKIIMIDLHSHSLFSDGCLSPTDLVDRANLLGIDVLALTDHSTIEGLPEFFEAAKKYPNFHPIAGCEVDASSANEYILHILAINIQDIEFIFEHTKMQRAVRLEAIIRRLELLKEIGISITLEEVKNETKGVITKRDLREMLVKRKIVKDIIESKKYFSPGGIAYYENKPDYPDKREVLKVIRDAGAVSVLAHPDKLGPNSESVRNSVKELVECGLMGIECYRANYSKERTEEYLGLAKEFNLVVSGGSDYHAKTEKPLIELGAIGSGVVIPRELLKGFNINL